VRGNKYQQEDTMRHSLLTTGLLVGLVIGFAFELSAGPADSQQLTAEIRVLTGQPVGRIDPDVYGLFTEMCYYEFNGGMWAEMLKARKFAEDDGDGERYGVVRPWFPLGKNDHVHFLHDNTVYYCGRQSQKIVSEDTGNRRTGIGQRDLYFQAKSEYRVRLNLKQEGESGPVAVALEGEGGIYAERQVTVSGPDWNRFSFVLTATHTDKNGCLTVTFPGKGTLWVGTASLMPVDNMGGFRTDVVQALKALHIPNLRWPGGNMVSVYRWTDGVGDRDKRPPRFTRELWEPNDVGIDEFIQLCRLIGTKPYLAVNAGDGTPEEAAAQVEYCNGGPGVKYGKERIRNGHAEPYEVRLWGIGNEMFGGWQNGHVDEETYASRHVAMAKAMRAVDSNVKIVASGARYWIYPRWNEALLRIAGDHLDYISLHSYAKKYRSHMKKEDLKDPKFAEEFYYYIVSSPYGIEEQIVETDKEIRRILPERADVKVAFDEWNCWAYREPYELVDFQLRDALYTAGPVLIGTEVRCDSFAVPEYEEGRPQAVGSAKYLEVSATTSEDEKTTYLAVINLHRDKAVQAGISFDAWKFSPAVKTYEIYDDDPMAENTFENPNRLTVGEGRVDVGLAPLKYMFKPHSVTVLEFRPAAGQ
jgi:alpha-N-arabinofuranosidase